MSQEVRSYGVLMSTARKGRVLRLTYAYNARDAIQQMRFEGRENSRPADREWPVEVGPAKPMRTKYPELLEGDE